jgi:hypothetical protein
MTTPGFDLPVIWKPDAEGIMSLGGQMHWKQADLRFYPGCIPGVGTEYANGRLTDRLTDRFID